MTLQYTLPFQPQQVSNTGTDLLVLSTSPTSLLFRNGRVRFANTTAGAVTIKAWALPAGASAADSNCILPTLSLAANTYVDLNLPIMDAGAILHAQAGAATSITASCLDGLIQT